MYSDKVFTEAFTKGNKKYLKKFLIDGLDEASRKGNTEVVHFLLSRSDDGRNFSFSCLKKACSTDNLKFLKILIEKYNADSEYIVYYNYYRYEKYRTNWYFYMACRNGCLEIVKYLLEKKTICNGIDCGFQVNQNIDQDHGIYELNDEKCYYCVYEFTCKCDYRLSGLGALKWALIGDQLEVFKYLMEYNNYKSVINTSKNLKIVFNKVKSISIFEYLVKENDLDLTTFDFSGMLLTSFIYKKFDMLKYLLENFNIDLNSCFGNMGSFYFEKSKYNNYMNIVFSYLFEVLECKQLLSEKNENILKWSLKNFGYRPLCTKYLLEVLPIQYIKEYRSIIIELYNIKNYYGHYLFPELVVKNVLLNTANQRLNNYENDIKNILKVPSDISDNYVLKYLLNESPRSS